MPRYPAWLRQASEHFEATFDPINTLTSDPAQVVRAPGDVYEGRGERRKIGHVTDSLTADASSGEGVALTKQI